MRMHCNQQQQSQESGVELEILALMQRRYRYSAIYLTVCSLNKNGPNAGMRRGRWAEPHRFICWQTICQGWPPALPPPSPLGLHLCCSDSDKCFSISNRKTTKLWNIQMISYLFQTSFGLGGTYAVPSLPSPLPVAYSPQSLACSLSVVSLSISLPLSSLYWHWWSSCSTLSANSLHFKLLLSSTSPLFLCLLSSWAYPCNLVQISSGQFLCGPKRHWPVALCREGEKKI